MNIQPLYYTIIRPKGELYNNTTDVDGQELILNTEINYTDHTYTNRVGIVVQTPANGAPYEIGDEVLVHHNVFRQFWNAGGDLATSSNLVDENLFKVEETTVFAYRKPGEEWNVISPYQLIEPVTDENGDYIDNYGKIYAGEGKGQFVIFTPSSEYEFRVDDDIFYKMRNVDIAGEI